MLSRWTVNAIVILLSIEMFIAQTSGAENEGNVSQPSVQDITQIRERMSAEAKSRAEEQWRDFEQARRQAKIDLDGRNVVVRIYRNWDRTRLEYEQVSLKLNGDMLDLRGIGLREGAKAVIVRSDQEDDVVKSRIRLAPILVNSEMQFSVISWPDRENKIWIFKDGEGELIPLATVNILDGSPEIGSTHGADIFLNGLGQCKWMFSNGGIVRFYIVLSHPDYGISQVPAPPEVRETQPNMEYVLYIPSVPRLSEAYGRSLRGVVVDDTNKPIPGARITGRVIFDKAEEVFSRQGTCTAITDSNGRFNFYLPTEKYDQGRLIPLGAKYIAQVEAPVKYKLEPVEVNLSNEVEHTIQLSEKKPSEQGYFHRFVFESRNGAAMDEQRLKHTSLEVTRDGNELGVYGYADFNEGREFPLGTYRVRPNYDPAYEDVEVNEQSPEEIMFWLKVGTTYSGQVIDGVTGLPVKGAFVLDGKVLLGTNYNLSKISDAQWEKLHNLKEDFELDDNEMLKIHGSMASLILTGENTAENNLSPKLSTLGPVAMSCIFTCGTRTDEEGKFLLRFKAGATHAFLSVFEKNYLCTCINIYSKKNNMPGQTSLGKIPLYPSATVKVKVVCADSNIFVNQKWIIDNNTLPKWAKCPSIEELMQAKKSIRHPSDNNDSGMTRQHNEEMTTRLSYDDPVLVLVAGLYEFLARNVICLTGIPVPLVYEPRPVVTVSDYNDGWVDDNSWVEPVPFEEDLNRVPTFCELLEETDKNYFYAKFEKGAYWQAGREHTVQVPAGIPVTEAFYVDIAYCRVDNWFKWARYDHPQILNLKQGEMLDLGTVEIKEGPQVTILVLGSDGKPLQGIPVRHTIWDNVASETGKTNQAGRAVFYSRYGMPCRFVVGGDSGEPNLRDELSYQLVGEKDKGKEFTIRVREEVLADIYK